MSNYEDISKRMTSKTICYSAGLFLMLSTNICFAQTIKIFPNTVIAYPKTYDNVTLDLSHGSFIIKDKASLTIKNSVIHGTLSKDIPVLISVESGKLNMEKNQVDIKTQDLPEHPLTQSLQYVVQVGLGAVNLSGNTFKIDQPYTSGLLITTSSLPSTGFQIKNNFFERFHGVLYLIASDNALVADNTFKNNSYGQIVMIGNNSKIIHNSIFFSGNYRLGNSIDIIDSSNISITKNLLFTPTCHGIYVLNSLDITIDGNRITGGITYAMNVLSNPETISKDDAYLTTIIHSYTANHPLKNTMSNRITISNNYMAQNRYGIAVSDIDHLTIKNNYFIQRFTDNESRKFWTNNNVLLQNVTNLSWVGNLYKEAYTQEINGDNSKSSKFVNFPQTGGVVL
jgi:parallel beta-helix repeat protein